MSYDNAIEIRHLTKDYGSFRLEDVNLDLPKGTILGLIGENGAGKSTTIKCILNLIRRDKGEIRVMGLDNLTQEREVKARTAVVFDECPFHENLTAAMVGQILAGVCPDWNEKRYAALVKEFELPAKKTVKEFSRGMKMKLSIAAALARNPQVLLLDEATSGLDPVARDTILEKLMDFVSDGERAVLLSSHITSDLEKAADYVAYLHKGKLLLQGEKDMLLSDFGRLACTRAELEQVDPAFLAGVRKSQFQCEALIRRRGEFKRLYPGLAVDPVDLEDIMVFTVRGEQA